MKACKLCIAFRDGVPKKMSSAGVIPYCVDVDGNVLLLLGREQYNASWAGGGRWSAFSGSRYGNETPEETSGREFHEELMGLSRVFSDDLSDDVTDLDVPSKITTFLCAKKHDYRMEVEIVRKTSSHVQVTYLMRVEYVPHICEEFALRRRILIELKAMNEQLRVLAASFPASLPFLTEGMTIQCRGGTRVVDCIKMIKMHDNTLTIMFESSDNVTTVVDTILFYFEDIEPVRKYVAWFHLRDRVTRYVSSLPFDIDAVPGVHVSRAKDASRRVLSVNVNAAFLEKDSVKYWSLTQLEDMLACERSRSLKNFRLYFLPTLTLAIKRLRELNPS